MQVLNIIIILLVFFAAVHGAENDCKEKKSQLECEKVSCQWVEGKCQADCAMMKTKTLCENEANCQWAKDEERDEESCEPKCEWYKEKEEDCRQAKGCDWQDGKCIDKKDACSNKNEVNECQSTCIYDKEANSCVHQNDWCAKYSNNMKEVCEEILWYCKMNDDKCIGSYS